MAPASLTESDWLVAAIYSSRLDLPQTLAEDGVRKRLLEGEHMSIQWFEGEDPEMLEAIRRAQDSILTFATELEMESRRTIPALSVAIVKAFIPNPAQPSEGEHMWLEEISFEEGHLVGSLNDDSVYSTALKSGSGVRVPFDHVSDWILFFGARQKLVTPAARGGFTLGVMLRRMSEAERNDMRAHAPFRWFLETNSPFGNA